MPLPLTPKFTGTGVRGKTPKRVSLLQPAPSDGQLTATYPQVSFGFARARMTRAIGCRAL